MRFLLAAVVAVLLVSVVPASTPMARAQSEKPSTKVEVTKITPSVVGGGAPAEMTISGRLTNTSNEVIDNVEARIQRGAPATSEPGVQEAMSGDTRTVTEPSFSPVAPSLAPGQQTRFELRIPISGGKDSLQISQPGVFPVLVNINGSEGGSRSRVGEARFLLPVSSPPGAPPAAPAQPTPTTMLVPIVDYPRMQQQASPGQPAVLVDDQLGKSLAPGGRLYELVQAVGDGASAGSPLGNALCFTVDPDLLSTVFAMQGGYRVATPNGGTEEGIGAGAARLWLSKLKNATAGRCVIALPYADADVVALGRADLPDLIKGALDGANIVQSLLGVEPRRDVLWPIDGALDEPAATQLTSPQLGPSRIRTMLMRPSALEMPQGSLGEVRLKSGGKPVAQPLDPLLTTALAPTQGAEAGPGDNGSLSAQDALGSLAFRATGGATQGTSVIAPPRRWDIDGAGMRALLDGMEKLTEANFLQPTGLPVDESEQSGPGSQSGQSNQNNQSGQSSQSGQSNQSGQGGQSSGKETASARPEPPQVGLAYPMTAATDEIQQPVLDQLARQNFKVGDLFRSSERDPAANRDPADLTTPLRDGLLRGASSAWRADPGTSRDWVRKAGRTIEGVLSNVQLAEFPRPIMLASSNTYIPVTVTNNLPVTLFVKLRVPRTVGIDPKDMGTIRFPAQGRRTIWLETEVHRAGQFTVDLSITTADGTELGVPRRVQIQSDAYGPFTLVLTIIAGALLVVLSARRIFRRVRARAERKAANAANGPAASAGAEPTAHVATTESDHEPS